jgi:hypothetical protein
MADSFPFLRNHILTVEGKKTEAGVGKALLFPDPGLGPGRLKGDYGLLTSMV